MFERVMTVMQDDLVMLALPVFFAALLIEWLWARKQFRAVYEGQDFWASMRIMVLTVFVDLIPKFLGITLMFVCYDLSPLSDWVGRTAPWWLLLGCRRTWLCARGPDDLWVLGKWVLGK